MSDGYEFVPLPAHVHREPRGHAIFDRRVPDTYSGTIELELEAEQPVHIGSGFKQLHGNSVVRAASLIKGRPGIPGSSLKGVLRSRYEAITCSCAGKAPPAEVGVTSETHEHIKKAIFTSAVLKKDIFAAQSGCTEKRLCAACALFGRMSRRSRLSVTDLCAGPGVELALAEIAPQFGPNAHHVGGYRIKPNKAESGGEVFEVHSIKGRKFAVGMGRVADDAAEHMQMMQVIPRGARLFGEIRLVNVTTAELGGLLAALGRDPASRIKIGAGKGRRFGRMVLSKIGYGRLLHAGNPVKMETQPEEIWRRDFEASTDFWTDGMAKLVAIHHEGC